MILKRFILIKMREIKFRAWDKKKKVMFYSYDNYLKVEGNLWSLWEKNEENKLKLLTNHITGFLMEFVGLKDKNGKEIFEGDILKSEFKHSEEELILMEWIGGKNKDFQGFDICQVFQKYKVIGNIYENPELLEVKK